MRNILTYLSITLLCLGTSIVFSDHNEGSNNGGHSAWGQSYNSNTYIGKKYTDKYYQVASDYEWPLSADTSTETTRVGIPGVLYCYASWSCKANIRCDSHFYRGDGDVYSLIVVDGDTKDADRGSWTVGYFRPEYEGKYTDRAKAYHSENDTGPNASYPLP